jgi:galactose oxidase
VSGYRSIPLFIIHSCSKLSFHMIHKIAWILRRFAYLLVMIGIILMSGFITTHSSAQAATRPIFTSDSLPFSSDDSMTVNPDDSVSAKVPTQSLSPEPQLMAQAVNTCAAIDPNSYYQITARHSNKSLDVYGGSQDNGAKIIQWPYGGGNNQQWQFKPSSNGYYTITARHSQKNANVEGGSQNDGAGIIQWPASPGETNEQWCLKSVGSDYYNIIARHSQKTIDVPGSSQTDGTQVMQWPNNNTANQQWLIAPVATIPQPGPASIQGRWSPKINFPSIPVAAALLPNRKVVTWSSYDRNTFVGNPGDQKTYTAIFDPQNNSITENLVTNTSHDMFCPGTAMLKDGRLLVNGGGPTVASTSIFNPTTGTWTRDADMAQRRWYNSSIALPDGGVLTMGGNRTSGLDGRGEVWQAGQGWRTLTGALMNPLYSNDPNNRSQEHPELMVAPNGKLFAAGPTPNMQWYDLAGNGSYQAAGTRGNDQFAQNATYTMYDVGKILTAGGNPNYDGGGSDVTPSSSSAYVIDISQGATVQQVQSMKYPRAYANSVVLPDGKVLVVGGLNNGKAFSDNGAILAPELFDPVTKSWTTMTNMVTPRTYHSVALLLPDGRVLAAGGGLCGTCNVNHSDGEIFSPPYLFRGARPVISSAPGSVTYAQNFNVQASDDVSKFTLVRLSSVTHSVNTDQRFKQVNFSKIGRTYTLNLQSNANITPPGYYMLFGLNNQGIPSVSKIMKVGA